MKIKHWDEASQSWKISAASNASNLELTNPSYLDNQGKSVTIDHGFTKIANKITKIEQNLAWIYLNGALGGGSGGGIGDGTYTIEVDGGNTVYTSTSSASLNITILSGSQKKSFTLVAKNTATNAIVGTWKIYSLTKTKITIPNLTGTVDIELSAYDVNSNFTIPKYMKIVSGAISLSLQSVPDKTIYIGGSQDSAANFIINNNISGVSATFVLSINNIEIVKEENITTSIRTLSYNIRNLLFNTEYFSPISGQKFIFKAYSFTSLSGETIESEHISFDVTVADSQKLLIIVDNVSDFFPTDPGKSYEDLTAIEQDSRLIIPYYLSYGLTKYNSFNLEYNIYKSSDLETPLLTTNEVINNIPPRDSSRVISINASWPINELNEYYVVKLHAFHESDPNEQHTIYVTFRILEKVSSDLEANNDIKTLLAYFSNITGFPSNTTGTWTYKFPLTEHKFQYAGIGIPSIDNPRGRFPDGIKLTLKDVNGVSTGFLPESARTGEVTNGVPGIKLDGESYGYIELAEQMFPNVAINSGLSFFQGLGFNFSFTYKAVEASNTSGVIAGIGKYVDGELSTGFEITLDKVYLKVGTGETITCKLPQNKLLTVDIDVSFVSGGWYFKIYINGILSAVTRVLESAIDWQFNSNIHLGCRNNNGIKSNFADVTFYDIKIYTSSQSEYAIVQNYISATEQASLKEGKIDANLDARLRNDNFFDTSGKCIIWDHSANNGRGEYLSGLNLYNTLIGNPNNQYPVVLVEETSSSSTLFKAFSTAVFSAEEKANIMNETFPVKITYTPKVGNPFTLMTPSEVGNEKGVRIGLQGTSSLSYNAKNFEIYCGDKNAAGDKLLFMPTDDWLPENQFTLKADVMDSSHVNNVLIGKIINGEIKRTSGNTVESVTPLVKTPPMQLGDDVWGGDAAKAESIRSKIKHTSDGFPCLLFITYAPSGEFGIKETKFMGIYNFNLGRHAEFNLGLKLLLDYEKVSKTEGPSTVEDYIEDSEKWNSGVDDGAYSIEINQNSSGQGAFQQDNIDIIKFMGDVIYSSKDKEIAYTKVQKLYSQMANMTQQRIPKYTMTSGSVEVPRNLYRLNVIADLWNPLISYSQGDYAYNSSFHVFKSLHANNNNQIPLDTTGDTYWEYYDTITDFYTYNPAYYNFEQSSQFLNWENAIGYFMIAIIFGMVDSLCKNLTLRNWGHNVWYTAFYDMDTAFGLNNTGQDIVEYWAHIHRWQNVNRADTNLTGFEQIKNYPPSEGYKQFYASWWNRIWEILENLGVLDSGGVGDRDSLETAYARLRFNLFPDPDKFIEDYYEAYTNQTGSIMFNYDYKVKYLKIAQTYTAADGYVDSTDFSQLRFLHGNRVIHVKDWFKKRIYFLDSVYGVSKGNVIIDRSLKSPLTSSWLNNKASRAISNRFITQMAANSKLLFRYSFDKTSGSLWLDDKPQDVILASPEGETIVTLGANKYITKFSKFNSYLWTALGDIDFPLLEELDLSGITNIPHTDLFTGGKVYNRNSDVGLKNIRKLNLSNVKLTGPAYTLNVEDCERLQDLDISYSSITNVQFSSSSVLKKYNLSGTGITTLTLKDQAFLDDLKLENCNDLVAINIENCNKLANLDLPKNVRTVKITNCALLESINLPYFSSDNSISALNLISIDNCPGLKVFNVTGQNNPALKIELVGAKNLENLILTGIVTSDILLPPLKVNGENYFTSLKVLDISRTNIKALKYNDQQNLDYLDLTNFPNLKELNALECKQLVKVKASNLEDSPVELQSRSFFGCSLLQRIEGHYRINGSEIFKGCGSLILNSEEIYSETGTNFIPNSYPEVTNISISNSVTNLYGTFEGCSKLTYNDFNYLKIRIGPSVTSIEAIFKGCSNINGVIHYDLFRTCPNLLSIKEAFSGCKLSGRFYSRSLSYNVNDKQTWGILDFAPRLQDAEAAFENNLLTWIDNRVFEPIIIEGTPKYYDLVRVNKMFRGNITLESCEDTTVPPDQSPIPGNLESKTFFINLRNLLSVYPEEVFAGCTKINMNISNVGNTSLLFHTTKNNLTPITINNLLYSGVNLVGDIKVNTFGGITKNIIDGTNTYYIPTFSHIERPFSTSLGNITVRLSKMGDMFKNIGTTLIQAVNIFSKVKVHPEDSGTIPPNIFKGCVALDSIEGFFSNLDLMNNNEIYEFPAKYMDNGEEKGMFDDCKKLRVIKNLFTNNHNLKIKLVGEGFKNCTLTNVSEAFSNSGVFGIIPYRLFFMVDISGGYPVIRQSITNMEKIFNQCWCLGYDETRKIKVNEVLQNGVMASWSLGLEKVKGNPVTFKLDVTNLKKEYNYSRFEMYIPLSPIDYNKNKYTKNGSEYTLYDTSGITFYKKDVNDNYLVYNYNGYTDEEVYTESSGIYTLYTVPSLYVRDGRYSKGEYAFDTWYLDGYGWEGAQSSEPILGDGTDLADVKESITESYLSYDLKQKQIREAHINANTDYIINQNYKIPTDLFRYCNSDISSLKSVLQDLNWTQKIEIINDLGVLEIIDSKEPRGLVGRLPMRLFEALPGINNLEGVFEKVKIEPFIDVAVYGAQRGLLFPPDLLRYNSELRNISSLFRGIKIPAGIDINKDLLYENKNLTNISNLFSDCEFDRRYYNVEDTGTHPHSPQIDWNMFKYNVKITNASGLFAVFNSEININKGLWYIDSTLFNDTKNMNNISNMFYNNKNMTGAVPVFHSLMYPILTNVTNYLYGVPKGNITNADELENRLKPLEWLT